MSSAISAAKSALAKQLNIGTDLIQLVSIQQVQWPDGCLGIQQPGIMCAMHVVDGYRITLSENDQTYEIRTSLDGSQIVFVDGSMPEAGRISFTTHNEDGCQIFLITESNGVAYGSCNGKLEMIPFVESSRSTELDHFITTFKSFSFDTSNGSVDIIGTGSTTPSVDERRSISIWIKLVIDETQAGCSSAANGLVIGWHREGGLAGFCDDLSVYATGAVSASSCKNGQAKDLGQTWLDNEQLSQLYKWIDSMGRFESTLKTGTAVDALTITLDFSGQGNAFANESDQQSIQTFTEKLFPQGSDLGVLPNNVVH
jgi:hypothetical protein